MKMLLIPHKDLEAVIPHSGEQAPGVCTRRAGGLAVYLARFAEELRRSGNGLAAVLCPAGAGIALPSAVDALVHGLGALLGDPVRRAALAAAGVEFSRGIDWERLIEWETGLIADRGAGAPVDSVEDSA